MEYSFGIYAGANTLREVCDGTRYQSTSLECDYPTNDVGGKFPFYTGIIACTVSNTHFNSGFLFAAISWFRHMYATRVLRIQC